MKNFAKGSTYFVFGVLFSPILFGMFTPLIVWNLTYNPIATMVLTAAYIGVWAGTREAMIARKWHYHI